jgi:hypothetical protein
MEEAGRRRLDLVTGIQPNMSDALQVLSSSQVTPELSMSMRIRPICKRAHIHTYIPLMRNSNDPHPVVSDFCQASAHSAAY